MAQSDPYRPPGIGLTGDGIGIAEPELLADETIEGLYFAVIPIEKGEEGGLGTRRSFDATAS